MLLPPFRRPEGQAGLDAIRAAPGRALIASDFDGTLSPIVPDPMSARAYPGAVQALSRLASPIDSIPVVGRRRVSASIMPTP